MRDVVIGMSDGLTVPFALAAGLSGAIDNSHIVVVAGLAEIAAGSIAMGLGGYLAAKAMPSITSASASGKSGRSRRFQKKRLAKFRRCLPITASRMRRAFR